MFDAIEYINEPRWQHVSLGLERMTLVLEKLGSPQKKFASVHVAGTNGKGSTCAYLSNILQCAGYKTGLFTSPFVHNFEERICINGNQISLTDLTQATLKVKEVATEVELQCGEHPTEFELMFAVACVYFSEENCDICVIEVGLGGRLDATNVISPLVCVLTPISLDHTAILGSTYSEIAKEKSGIIKPQVPVVSAPQNGDAISEVEHSCEINDSPLFIIDYSKISNETIDFKRCRQSFSYEGDTYVTKLLGSYQPKNAVLAIESAKVLTNAHKFAVSEDDIKNGIANTSWPGRFEVISSNPLVIVDGAHNPHGANALVQAILASGLNDVSVIMGAMSDKDIPSILHILQSISTNLYAYTADNPRAECAANIAKYAQKCGFKTQSCSSVKQALLAAHKERPEHPIVALGSLYSISAVKQAAKEIF